MLAHLSVRDFAIIDALDLALEPGMTVVTGETGAGKSIVIDALTLVLGGRARSELIRNGCDKATASAQFVAQGATAKALNKRLDDAGLPPCDEGSLIVRRVLSNKGRHKQFINGALCTSAQLRDVLTPLIDITSQHAEQALKEASTQRGWLDAYGRLGELTKAFALSHAELREKIQERELLFTQGQEGQSRLDWLRFQIEEIENLAPMAGELDELKSERARLKNVETLRRGVHETLLFISHSDEGAGDALSRLHNASATLTKASSDDTQLLAQVTLLDEAAAIIDDVSRELERYGENLNADPARLEELDERIDALQKLARKHGDDLEGVLEKMRGELDAIENNDERLASLDKDIEEKRALLSERAKVLTTKRKSAARALKKQVEAELKDLGMAKAKIEFAIAPLAVRAGAVLSACQSKSLAHHGADDVCVMLQANPGEDPAPLKKAASGGELSRVQLALKRVLLEKDPVPVTIFDEVDAGVSGSVAAAIGEKLRAVSEGAQVIVISHSPQIASCAHAQLEVRKEVTDNRTRSIVETVDGRARVEAIAKMLGGKTITKAARASAEELLRANEIQKQTKSVTTKKAPSKAKASKKVAAKKVPPKKSAKKASKKVSAKARAVRSR